MQRLPPIRLTNAVDTPLYPCASFDESLGRTRILFTELSHW